jgi:Tfp pilus assembly protein PilF
MSAEATLHGENSLGSQRPQSRLWWLALAVIAVVVGVVYWPAIDGPFFADDQLSIVENESIRTLWPLWGDAERGGPLAPPRNTPVSARPLVNLSLALNYQVGGIDPRGYRVVNLLIHLVNVVLLASLLRRALRLRYFGGKFYDASGPIALVVAMLWALHPLVTEAVVYATQRTELMATLFYLATLYGSLRYWEAKSTRWLAVAVLACWAGMASKEVMVTAPVLVLLFDRTFNSRTLREAWQQSKGLYIGLFAGWLLVLCLAGARPIDESAGFHLGVSAVDWWYTQSMVLLMYLRLAVWPWPLSIHYEPPYLTSFAAAWMYVLPVTVLVIGTLVLLWRRSAVGWLGTLALAVLAPTLVIPIVTEIAAERRMYLPLAALVTLVVAGGYLLLRRVLAEKPALRAVALVGIALALVGGVVSSQRLDAFADDFTLWHDIVVRDPQNATAQYNVGTILLDRNEAEQAAEYFRRAIALRDDFPHAHHNLGSALSALGKPDEATREFERAVELEPRYAMGRVKLGLKALAAGRTADAKKEFETALHWHPNDAAAHAGMVEVLLKEGKAADAVYHGRAAVTGTPDDAKAHNLLGAALAQQGEVAEAVEQFETAVRLDPTFLQAQGNLMAAYASVGRPAEAITTAQKALALAKAQGDTQLEEQINLFLFDYRMGAGGAAVESE